AVVEAALDRPGVRDDVADASYFAFEPSAFLGERSAPVVFGFPNASDTDLPILDGRAARRPGEAVIGADTASRLDLSVGDRVTITSTSFDPVDARVVGIAVMPAAGQFGADRPGLGTGAFVLVDAPPAELVGMVGLRLADDVDPTSLVAELGDLSSWDLQGAPIVHASPVRSPQIANASDLRSVPLVLGGVLVIGLGLGLGLSIVSSVRGRSRELAILRVLGFTDRQVQASVRWQAAAVVSVGLVVGTPLGVVAGRFAWHRFADDLGVGRTASLAPRWLGLYLVVVAVLAFVASAPAVRRAGRSTVARVLRED
ncbi:MAG: ABC transporter permease, partial [Actinobacteria bacterium]|nr:ABC transporter permease [Actinomycetota bacterium]